MQKILFILFPSKNYSLDISNDVQNVLYFLWYIFDKSFTPVIFISKLKERFIAQKLDNWKYLLFTEKWMKLNWLFSKQYDIIKYLSKNINLNNLLF
jgi:hypothetical protein